MVLIKENALKIIRENNRIIYIFKCKNKECTNEIRPRTEQLETHLGTCRSCSSKKKPYECIYNRLLYSNSNRKNSKPNKLTYEVFIKFTKIKNCHYCNEEIHWTSYRSQNETSNQGYHLDRMNSNKAYDEHNCVVCCTGCNRMKSNKFTYEEFLIIGQAIKEVKSKR